MRLRYAPLLVTLTLLALPFSASAQEHPDLPNGTLSLLGTQLSPQPSDAGGGNHLTTGARSYLSPVLEASTPFTIAGPFWKPSDMASGEVSIALRASADGVTWSEWVPTGHGAPVDSEGASGGLAAGGWSAEPVLFGEGNRFVQMRVTPAHESASLPDLDRLSVYYVDAAPGPDHPSPVNEQRFAEDRMAFEQSGSMQVAEPRIYARSEWGARNPNSSWSYFTPATHLAIHHSASTGDGNADTWSECAAAVRGVQNYHMNVNGWSDIGYNYLVCPTGDIFAGREDTNHSTDVVGAHDSRNQGSVGVNGLGYYHPPYNQSPTNAMLDGFADLFAWIADRRGIDPSGSSYYAAHGATMDNIYGHRQVKATACPGDGLFALKSTVISRTEDRLSGAQGLTAVWQRNGALGGRPSWFSSTASSERGLAYARVGSQDRLYVVSRSGGTSVRILNASTGSDVGTLSTSGISGGTYPLNDIESSSDGILFAANLTTNTIDSNFRVYRWSSESATPVRVIDFRTWSTPMRLGDHITVTGSTADNSLTIYAPTSGGDYVVVFTTSDNGASFSHQFVNVSNGGTLGQNPAVAPFASDFYIASRGVGAQHYTSTGALIGAAPSSAIPTTVGSAKSFATSGSTTRKYLALFDFSSASNHGGYLRVADVTSGATGAQSVGETPWLGGASNPNGAGDVAVKSNGDGTFDLFVLSTNNGLASYRMGSSSSKNELEPESLTAPVFALSGVYPNPTSGVATVAYDLPDEVSVSLEVYDLLGRRVAEQIQAYEPAGARSRTLDLAHLPSGVYLVRLLAGERVATSRLTLVTR